MGAFTGITLGRARSAVRGPERSKTFLRRSYKRAFADHTIILEFKSKAHLAAFALVPRTEAYPLLEVLEKNGLARCHKNTERKVVLSLETDPSAWTIGWKVKAPEEFRQVVLAVKTGADPNSRFCKEPTSSRIQCSRKP